MTPVNDVDDGMSSGVLWPRRYKHRQVYAPCPRFVNGFGAFYLMPTYRQLELALHNRSHPLYGVEMKLEDIDKFMEKDPPLWVHALIWCFIAGGWVALFYYALLRD